MNAYTVTLLVEVEGGHRTTSLHRYIIEDEYRARDAELAVRKAIQSERNVVRQRYPDSNFVIEVVENGTRFADL